jgi:hypothetical protein
MFKMTRARLILDLFLAACLAALIGAIISVIWMPGASYRGPFEPLSPSEKVTEASLRRHVQILAGDIGQRNTDESLKRAQDHITSSLAACGYKVEEQHYVVDKTTFRNLVAEVKGTELPAEILLVGAHYDSVFGCPGANDNGSGAAAVLEVARLQAGRLHRRTVRYVFFGTEEPPFFSSTEMGSYHYAKQCFEKGEDIKGLLVLETLGYYTDKPDTQSYPCLFVPGYPTTGNFVVFVGNTSSRSLVEHCVGAFRKACKFPSEGVSAPEWINGLDWSDQYWFWRKKYPAVMITDTAPFRYQYYHTTEDKPEKLNYPCFARVVTGLSEVLSQLARN